MNSKFSCVVITGVVTALCGLSPLLPLQDVYANSTIKLKPEFGRVVAECKNKGPKQVWLFKQWHLSPLTNTRNLVDQRPIPQQVNQTAIYLQLDKWIQGKELKEVYAEGCSGELNAQSKLVFNGWTVKDLEKASNRTDYPNIVSSVPLKLEA